MTRFSFSVLLAFLLYAAPVAAFTAAPARQITTNVNRGIIILRMAEEDKKSTSNQVERGVSVDQDGKSNVWAIEPKMEVSSKSSEETTQSAVIAGVGLGVAVVIAGLVLSNLPDPNQF